MAKEKNGDVPQGLRVLRAQARATLKELKGKEYTRGYAAGLKAGSGLLRGGRGR